MLQTKSALEQLMQDRKSVRKYKEGVTIPREQLLHIIAEATSAPSSSNMQPWRFLIIDDQQTKEELLPIAANQEQIVTSSAIIAVIGDVKMYEHAQQIYDANVAAGSMSREIADNMIANSHKLYSNLNEATLNGVIHFDAGLITMQIMLIAKEMGYDTVPMGGFNKQAFAEKMNLADNETPILLLPIGEAAHPAHQTSRLPLEQIVRFA